MATPLRVLIIENSENDALLIADCLSHAGYILDWRQVETSAQMAEALAPPKVWDLILSDYSMPEFSGLRALALYKQSGLDIPFLLISGSIGEERAVEAMRSGAHDYIMKDRMQRLGPAVDRELREAANRRERRQALNENQRLNDELRAQVELLSRSRADLEQVTWAASHDLKEPLRIVTSYSQLLVRRRANTTPDEAEFSRFIAEGVDRAAALIDGLLAYARNLRPPADLSVTAEAGAVARQALSNLAVVIEMLSASLVIDPLPAVRIAPAALLEVFEHLFRNALEYAGEGVQPRIHVSCARTENESGFSVRFSVKDNGIGIKPEHHGKIFQLFRRLHGSEHPGIGVGLSLSKRLIENYGGRLWLESEPGAGSTFFFTLALAHNTAAGVAN